MQVPVADRAVKWNVDDETGRQQQDAESRIDEQPNQSGLISGSGNKRCCRANKMKKKQKMEKKKKKNDNWRRF